MIRSAETLLSQPKVDVIHKNKHISENKFFYLEPPCLTKTPNSIYNIVIHFVRYSKSVSNPILKEVSPKIWFNIQI